MTRTSIPYGTQAVTVERVAYSDAPAETIVRIVPIEAPIALEFNGIGYAVMMGTPTDLEDFVTGFMISEGLATAAECSQPTVSEVDGGWIIRAQLPDRSMPRILERARFAAFRKAAVVFAASIALRRRLPRFRA